MPSSSKDHECNVPLVHLMHRASQAADTALEAELQKLGLALTARQLTLMQAIHAHVGASQILLAAITGVDRSTLSDLMRRLVRSGLAQRRHVAADKRAYAVSLTDAGLRQLHLAEPALVRAGKKLLSVLPFDRRKPFARSLSRITDHFNGIASSAKVECPMHDERVSPE